MVIKARDAMHVKLVRVACLSIKFAALAKRCTIVALSAKRLTGNLDIRRNARKCNY